MGLRRLVSWISVSLALGCATTPDGEVEKTPEQLSEFHYKLANGYFYEHQVPAALAELTTAIQHNPENPDAHHLLGFIYFGRKDFVSAESHFRRALEIRPGFHQARANLGALLLEQRRWRDSIEAVEPLVGASLYPTPWVPYNNLGLAYEGLGERRKALEQYKMALFHQANFCLGLLNAGRMLRELGDLDPALEHFRRATDKCKSFPDPHFQIAEILEERGQLLEARNEFQACWKDAPDSPLGMRCKRRL